MTNKNFYAFCRDRRKIETDVCKKEALQAVYGFMWECGVSKQGVAQYVERCIYQSRGNEPRIAAYKWLQQVFDGSVS